MQKKHPTSIQSAENKYLRLFQFLQDWVGSHTIKVEENYKYI
jgi:hypothetical protein